MAKVFYTTQDGESAWTDQIRFRYTDKEFGEAEYRTQDGHVIRRKTDDYGTHRFTCTCGWSFKGWTKFNDEASRHVARCHS